jgi:hypothetical protein
LATVLALVSVLLIFFVVVGLMLPALLRLCKSCHIDDLSEEWRTRFTPRSYDQMDSLLSDEDFSFLSRQPGFDLGLYRKFRRDRLHIYRQYLHRMITDFNRLHLAARVLLSQSHEDQSAILKRLLWLKVRFSCSILQVELRFAFYRLGLGALCARQLITELEELTDIFGTACSITGSAFSGAA